MRCKIHGLSVHVCVWVYSLVHLVYRTVMYCTEVYSSEVYNSRSSVQCVCGGVQFGECSEVYNSWLSVHVCVCRCAVR